MYNNYGLNKERVMIINKHCVHDSYQTLKLNKMYLINENYFRMSPQTFTRYEEPHYKIFKKFNRKIEGE